LISLHCGERPAEDERDAPNAELLRQKTVLTGNVVEQRHVRKARAVLRRARIARR
jgi:hypothetical protein